ncbi:MAG: hypothetical protein JXR19_03410 [Bacteroidia bacterium]
MNSKIYKSSFINLIMLVLFTSVTIGCSRPANESNKESSAVDSLRIMEAKLQESEDKLRRVSDTLLLAMESNNLAINNAHVQDSLIHNHKSLLNQLRNELQQERDFNMRPVAEGMEVDVRGVEIIVVDTCLRQVCPNCSTPCN